MKERIPDFFLEQYLIGEAASEIAHRIENDTDAQARLRVMEADNEEIFRTYPTGWVADRVAERLYTRRGTDETSGRIVERIVRALRAPLLIPMAALAVIAALVLPGVLTERGVGGTAESAVETHGLATGERMKGLDPQISVYRGGTSGSVEELSDESDAREGDRLQIAYRAAGAAYGSILSVDGRGAVTLHFPETAAGSTALVQDAEVALPYAYILDDAPSFETFFFVASAEPISVTRILSAVDDAVNDADQIAGEVSADASGEIATALTAILPEGAFVDTFTLLKTRGE